MAVDITPQKDGGVLKEILTPGDGLENPPNGSTVKAHYHGTLTDGTVFDSSVTRGEPFEFTLGKGNVIKAWDLGVATMTKGEKAKLTCKAEYAYGERGSPPKIPGGATLIFEIELLSWQEEDLSKAKDGGILRSIIEPGTGVSTPAEFRECKVHISGSRDGQTFDEREVSFTLGEGNESNIPRGLERAIEKMKEGEKSKITLSPQYTWPNGKPELGIPPGSTLKYIVKLIAFEKDKEAWDMDAEDRIKESEFLKARATAFFKSEKYKLALRLYNKAVGYIDQEMNAGYSEEEEEERKKAFIAIQLNIGLVHLKLKEYYDAKNACDKVLKLDASNVKALFRRGQAYLNVNEPEVAKADFERVVELEPNNSAAHAQVNACKNKIKEIKAKEKQIYSNMFEKLARKDMEDHFHYGWWDERQKKPVITEIIPEDKEDVEERKREKRKQLQQLKRIAEEKRKEKEEAERLARERGELVAEDEGENKEKVIADEAIIGPNIEKKAEPSESGVENSQNVLVEETLSDPNGADEVIVETAKDEAMETGTVNNVTKGSIDEASGNRYDVIPGRMGDGRPYKRADGLRKGESGCSAPEQ